MDKLEQIFALISSLTGVGHEAAILLVGVLSALVLIPVAGFGVSYVKRKLKPLLTVPKKATLCGCEPALNASLEAKLSLFERFVMALDYLSSRREWLYKKTLGDAIRRTQIR